MKCERCDEGQAKPPAHYCQDCINWFRAASEAVKVRSHPAPGVIATGQFRDVDTCPRTFGNAEMTANACGLCGSEEIESGYGFAGGYGLGLYNFCRGCSTVLDFSPDSGE